MLYILMTFRLLVDYLCYCFSNYFLPFFFYLPFLLLPFQTPLHVQNKWLCSIGVASKFSVGGTNGSFRVA